MNRELPTLNKSVSIEEATDLLNRTVETVNYLLTSGSFKNFDVDTVTAQIPAGEEKNIPHKLGIIPKGRIIIRQEGNGVISDIPSSWTNKQIRLKNNGAVDVTVTLIIVRE